MIPTRLRQGGFLLFLSVCSSMASPRLLHSPLEASGDEEELLSFNPPLPTSNLSLENRTTPVGPTQEETNSLKEFANFLNQNMLFILIAVVLLLLLLVAVCGAVFVSRRCKVSAYYPSAFPSKMYVDQHDKTGGGKLFNEVQDKAAPEQVKESVDSHRQLQADIMRAAKSLRTPSKSEKGEQKEAKAADPVPDSLTPASSPEAQQLSSLPEEKEQCGPSDGAEAAGGPTEQEPQAEQKCSPQPASVRSLRPSSLHIHHDQATLQLIAGEKTAF